MSMRKYKRSIMRAAGENKGYKPSRFVAMAWNEYQVNKVGRKRRKINVAKGTHPKRSWRNRIADALM